MKSKQSTDKKELCEHDYENYKRLGRAHLVCPKCGEDITLLLVLLAESEERNIKGLNNPK